MKNILVLIGTFLILVYLLLSRDMWLSGAEEQVKVSKDRLAKQIDINAPGTITWKINEDDWDYTGEVRVALIVDNLEEIPREKYDKETMSLNLKIDSHAITYSHTSKGRKEVLRANRLIKNWYFTTDEPLSPAASIWRVGRGATLEYGLGGVQRYLGEDTYIEVSIENPDPILNKANPRLTVVGDHDYAVSSHIGSMRTARDIILISLALISIAISCQAIKKKKNITMVSTRREGAKKR